LRVKFAGGAFPPLALALVALSWFALLAWGASPYGRYMNHGDWTALGYAGVLCASLPGGSVALLALLYATGWVVMSAAMMLPTSLPLVRLFDRMIAGRPDRIVLQALLIAGYMAAWAAFGGAAHVLDAMLYALLAGSTWLMTHAWAPGAAVLAVAGAFQFSRLKYVCLDACRSPLAFIMSYWHGPRPYREALAFAHGVYCVGCCWALMLLMFVVGTANLVWMLGLALLMAVEKNHAWGRRLAEPLGVVLLAAACVLSIVAPMTP